MSKDVEKTIEMKKADRKSKIIFAVIMLGCFLGGAIGGFVSSWFADSHAGVHNFAQLITDVMNSHSYYVGALVSAVAGAIALILYRQSRKAYEIWDEEDDEGMNKIEEKLSLVLIITNVALIFTYISTSIGIGQLPAFFAERELGIVKSLILVGGIIFSLVVMLIFNERVVSFEKELNPEKKGNIYDFNFLKKWMDSSDEAEKLIAYKCGFAAYKTASSTCSLMLLLCMLGMRIWQWDNVPVLMVGVIWLALYLGYSVEALKLSKHASRIQE